MGRTSLRARLTLFVLATIGLALLLSAGALLAHEVFAYRRDARADLATQAELVAQVAANALIARDPRAARDSLDLLRVRPQIRSAELFDAGGRPFARYASDGHDAASGDAAGLDIAAFSQAVMYEGQPIGRLALTGRYPFTQRLLSYLAILVAAMGGSLLLAAVVWGRLQRTALQPVAALAAAARDVVARADYSVRVPRVLDDVRDDELGGMVDAFNTMLAEVQRRTAELAALNRALQDQVARTEQAQDELRAADRRKDEFLATLAHELRNPLAPISNALHLLTLQPLADPRQAWARDVMARQVRHMARLIDDLLDVARITRGQIELRVERIDLCRVLHAAVEQSQPLIERRRHTLQVDLPDAPVWIAGDATRLSQVVANLLNNAAIYTPSGGRITLALGRAGEGLQITVADTGIGLAADDLQKIFGMFAQAEPPVGTVRAGLGIGLALAQALVTQHGGSIRADSAGLGCGSRFTVWLRAGAPEARDAPAPAAAQRAEAARSQRVLVVDDNADAAHGLALMLEALGHEVREAHDGHAALALGAEWLPQVVLMDIGMPRLDGHQTALRVRSAPWGAQARLIAVSGHAHEQDIERSARFGFEQHLTKPVDMAALERLMAPAPPAT